MRNLNQHNHCRLHKEALRLYGDVGDETCGIFRMTSPVDGQPLTILASSAEGWEHVSVSRPRRTPTWGEMEFVKKKFFNDDETVMQLHVPQADHINVAVTCLHLWRPTDEVIPRPPGWMVGPKDREETKELVKQMRGETKPGSHQ